MKTKMAEHIFYIVLLINAFFIESNYGSIFTEPFLFYRSFYGISGFSVVIIFLYIILKNRKPFEISILLKALIWLLAVTLIIEYLYVFLFSTQQSSLGTGFLEIRMFLLAIITFYVFKKIVNGDYTILILWENISRLSFYSAIVYLILFILKVNLFTVDFYGNVTMFEGYILISWIIYGIYEINNYFRKDKNKGHLIRSLLQILVVLLSYRRSAILIMIVGYVISLIFIYKGKVNNIKKLAFRLVILFSLSTIMLYLLPQTIKERIDVTNFFDVESDAYQRAAASNIGRTRDFIIALEIIKNNPIMGLGPGIPIINNYFDFGLESFDVIVNTLVHSEYLHYWIRLGVMGFIWILVFYYYVLSRSYRITLNRSKKEYLSIGTAIFSFFLPYVFIAITLPPFIYSQKNLFFIIMIVFSLEKINQGEFRFEKQTD